MFVKEKLVILLLLIITRLFEQITPAGIKCNQDLLNHYKLSGNEFSSYHTMKVCPMVRERCCSLSDEIIIQSLWNTRSKIMLNRHRDKCIQNIIKTIDYFSNITQFDPKLIMVKHGVVRNVPLNYSSCDNQLGPINATEIERIEGYYLYANQVNLTVIPPAQPWSNKWQSRNPAHFNWNIANFGRNYAQSIPRPNTNNLAGPTTSGSDMNGIINPDVYFRDPMFNSNLMGPEMQKGPLPRVPDSRKKKERRLQTNSINRDNIIGVFAATGTRLSGKRQTYRQTVLFKTNCKNQTANFTKEFIIVNTAKAHFCLNIYKGFLNFDIEMFQGFLPIVKQAMTSIHDVKKGFYCAICDANQRDVFIMTKKAINYDVQFCKTLLVNYRDYLRFMNVFYIQYIDQIFQYIQCFESDGKIFSFPYQNFLRKYLRRIRFWERCFNSLAEDGTFYEAHCWSICNKWSLTKASPLFDGDLVLLERITATIFSFLRKWQFEIDLYDPIKRNRTSTTYIGENVFNLKATDNVNGLLMEPINPSYLITANKYIADSELQSNFYNVSPANPISDTSQKQLVVNEMLKQVRLGNWTSLKNYVDRPRTYQQTSLKMNEMFLSNEDRQVSRVNGLLNKLYDLKTREQVMPSNKPSRYLKTEVRKILKGAGVYPKKYERMLNHYDWIGTNLTFNGTFRPQRIIRPTNFTGFDAYGFEKTFNKSVKMVLEFNDEGEEELPFVEPPFEMFEDIHPFPGVDLFIYSTSEKGLNPITESTWTNYRFNLTRLIGLQYQKSENIQSDIILMFMEANARIINTFNDALNDDIISCDEIQTSNPGYKSYETVAWIKILVDQDTSYGLFKQLENQENQKITKIVSAQQKEMLIARKKKEYAAAYKESMIYRFNETSNLKVHHHIDDSYFDVLFNSISDLFIGLFGS